jgi:type II secretory pathway component PulF
MCAIIGILGFISYYIVPKLKLIFEDFDVELPRITDWLIQSNDVLATYLLFTPLLVLPMAAICCLVVAQYYGWDSVPTGRLGRFFVRIDTPGILRSLGRAVSAQQPLDFSVERVADRHRRAAVRKQLNQVSLAVARGADCWEALHERRFITRHELAVLQSAQRAGNLPWALQQVAESIERRLGYRFGQLGEFLQPVLVMSVGLTVLFFCVGIFWPLVYLIRSLI